MKSMLDKKFILSFFLIFVTGLLFSQTEKENEIENVVIQGVKKYKNKKENPAYAIMREVWKKKKSNGLLLHKDYKYKTYEKIDFRLDNIDSAFTKKRAFKGMDSILFKYNDSSEIAGKAVLPIFITESIFQTYGKNDPKKERKDLIATRLSGLKNNQIVSKTIQNMYRDINIYDNTINYLNIGFVSPVSTDGFGVFDYNITDTIEINTVRSYEIRFTPKNPDALALKGRLYISMDKYNVMKVEMQTNKKININFVKNISTDLEFDNPDDSTFIPTRNETILHLVTNNKEEAKSVIARRIADYSEYEFDKGIADDFINKIVIPEDEAVAKDENFWENNRTEALTENDRNIYKMYDELADNPKYKKIVKIVEIGNSGFIHIGNSGIDFGNIFQSFGYNDIEGVRLRGGLRTYRGKHDMWRIQAYTAYGFRDQKWKYGGEAKYMFNKNDRFQIGAGYRKDVLQLGVQLTTDEGIMTRSFASSSVLNSGETTSMSSVNQSNFYTSIEPWKNIQLRVDATQQTIVSADSSLFNIDYIKNGNVLSRLDDTRVVFSIMARPGAKFSTYGVERYEMTALATNPTFILKYTKGFKDIFNSDFNYNKLQFYYAQPILFGNWGRMFANVEAGKNFESLPLALQNVLPANQSYGLVRGVFSLMNYYEFVADSYAVLFLEHHFNGKILSQIPLIKKLKLREVAFFRSGVGSLKQGSINMNAGNIKLTAPEKPYYEYGFGIENIGWGNFRLLRLDFNWRGNYLNNNTSATSEVRKFGVQFGFQANF
ncbi:DUF5686 family protein [Chryseobacterium sp. FH1]|uniref:DUF5686 family protein n=1 Tax=Chryseobacterium sp. FH1 TaxID=1233951 RepID=UPI00068EEA25|nr:DUF5686 family protein [Chryseobacterium sp. FH1]